MNFHLEPVSSATSSGAPRSPRERLRPCLFRPANVLVRVTIRQDHRPKPVGRNVHGRGGGDLECSDLPGRESPFGIRLGPLECIDQRAILLFLGGNIDVSLVNR